MIPDFYKGFTRSHLEWAFGVRFAGAGVAVPYYGIDGRLYREKLFSSEGRPLCWLDGAKAQIPYGLETLKSCGSTVFLTEGESCCWTLRAAFPSVPVIGIPGASSWRSEWSRLFARFPLIYLSFDNDKAGHGLLDSVWSDLPGARRVKLPEGLDTRDVLQLHGGIEAYERLLDDADYIAAATRYLLDFNTDTNTNRKDGLRHAA